MKAFKIYVNGRTGAKQQVKWLGALLLVIAIAIGVVGIINYFQFPQEAPEEFAFSVRALTLKELYIAAGIGIVGVIFLLAGSFAVTSNKEKE